MLLIENLNVYVVGRKLLVPNYFSGAAYMSWVRLEMLGPRGPVFFFFFFGLVFSVSDLFINDSIRFNRIKIILNLLCSFSDAIKITCKVQILYFLHVVNRL